MSTTSILTNMTRAVAGLHAPEAAPLLGQGAPQVGAGAMAVALVRGLELVAAREVIAARELVTARGVALVTVTWRRLNSSQGGGG